MPQYEYGEMVRLLKIANNISSKDLAHAAGLSGAYISNIILSKKLPPIKRIETLLNILNFTMYEYMYVLEFRSSLDPSLSDLKKYQLTLIQILTILVEKEKLNQEHVAIL